MDSLTHIVLGAVIGELVAGRKLGKKALVIGAVVNSLPDIDFLAAFWLDTSRDVCFHRGITHSLLFVAVVGVLLAVIGRRVYRARGMTMGGWIFFMVLELFSHIFIDAFNAYGTGWFEPFSHYRLSFNVIFVADPLYSVWLGLAALALAVLRRSSPVRRRWAWMGLLLSTAYLCYGLYNKWSVDRAVERGLRGVRISRYFSTPTPFNVWLWYVVAEDSAGYFTAYRSVFDAADRPMEWRWQPRNAEGLAIFRDRKDVGYLLRFAQGYYTVGDYKGRLVFNVLRFGEIQGWRYPRAPFVCHYFLEEGRDNQLVIQRGRWEGWDDSSRRLFVRRIEGR
ncbi:MAG TPA: metal-dependent hydrolase [Puia sp.]|jgi:inner membrane protein|nr:metal-dependent hydrolase [Puia sp.]